jgi:sugar phosphate isomerase/epimerase
VTVLFGGPVFLPADSSAGRSQSHGSSSLDFEALAMKHVEKGFKAGYAPHVDLDDHAQVKEARVAFERAGVTIAEVQCWNNLLDPVPAVRSANLEATVRAIALADELGAVCALNTAGSFAAESLNHHDPRNFGIEAFDAAVETARYLIDEAKPKRTKFAFEALAMHVTDGPETMERLVEAVDRPAFAVHIDLVNWVSSPRKYWFNGEFIREIVARLGPHIVAAHAKDIAMEDNCDTVRLEEVAPGHGQIEYPAYLGALANLPQPVTLLMEHLATEAEYDAAAEYIRSEARVANVPL